MPGRHSLRGRVERHVHTRLRPAQVDLTTRNDVLDQGIPCECASGIAWIRYLLLSSSVILQV